MSDVNTFRQSVLYADREFTRSDLTTGVPFPAIYLKPGTRILRGFVDITSPFDSDSDDTISVGDTEADDVDRYLVADDVAHDGGLVEFSLTPLTDGVIGTTEALTITWTRTGDASDVASAGAGRVAIEYVEDNRQTEVHTYRG